MSLSVKPIIHGRDHSPGGADPARAGVWHNIGDPGEPSFESGWSNRGGPDDVPMRFRLIIGPVNETQFSGALKTTEVKKTLEIQGDVTGGANATTVFTLPPAYRQDYSMPFPAHDDSGNYVACRLYKDGRFVRGAP